MNTTASSLRATLRATPLYVYLMARARFERRSEWILNHLERALPAGARRRSQRRSRGSSLLVVAACTLGSYAALAAASGATLYGVILLSSPVTGLSLLFAALMALAGSCGLSTVPRTTSPPDEERLLMAPLSERRAYSLAFAGADPLILLERLLVVPATSGVAASFALGGRLPSLPALWVAFVLVAGGGCAIALTVDRLAGAAWVSRTRRGARGASIAAYALFSAVACASGTLISRVLLAPFSEAPPSGVWGSLLRRASSLPESAVEALPLLRILAHPASPVGAPARWVAGGSGSAFAVAALWTGALALVAALLWVGGGGWYRESWRTERRGWDLFGLAESWYVALGRVLYRGDALVELQLSNLCRHRERAAAGPLYLFGGPLLPVWVGLAWGAAPALRSSEEAAAIFALVVGGWAASATARTPFEAFRASLSVDAEGRRAGLYRAAGVSVLRLYEAKVRAGGLICGVPLLALFALIAARLSPSAGVLLLAVFVVSWEVWPRVELLPGLASPHFAHEHSDEVGTPREQQGLSRLAEGAGGLPFLLGLVLALLLLVGWLPTGSFAWVAAPATLAAGAASSALLRLFGRRAAALADSKELPP